MGAYFSAVYACQHAEKVDHVILVSPAGVPDDIPRFTRNRSFLFRFVRFVWGKVTPQVVYRLSGPFGRWLAFKMYIERRYIARGVTKLDVSFETYTNYLAAYN